MEFKKGMRFEINSNYITLNFVTYGQITKVYKDYIIADCNVLGVQKLNQKFQKKQLMEYKANNRIKIN